MPLPPLLKICQYITVTMVYVDGEIMHTKQWLWCAWEHIIYNRDYDALRSHIETFSRHKCTPIIDVSDLLVLLFKNDDVEFLAVCFYMYPGSSDYMWILNYRLGQGKSHLLWKPKISKKGYPFGLEDGAKQQWTWKCTRLTNSHPHRPHTISCPWYNI